MVHQRALDLHRTDSMTGNVQHVVDATEYPVIAVVITLGAISGEVDVLPFRPIILTVPFVIAVNAAQHSRPRLGDGQESRIYRLPLAVQHIYGNTGEWNRC